jgi:uncharacterized repeat protein (TIGR01451 family)
MFLAIFLLSLSPAFGGTIYEKFNNNTYNHDLFWLGIQGEGTTAVVANKRLEITLPASSGGSLYMGMLESNFSLAGDFDVQVDFNLLTWPPYNEAQVGLSIAQAYNFSIFRRSRGLYAAGRDEVYYTMIMGHETYVPASGTSGKLRMTRTGNKMEGFYWDGEAWQSVGSYTDPYLGYPTTVNLNLDRDTYFSGPIVKAALDNYQITNKYLGNVLNFQKTDNPDPVAPGGNLTYTLCFDNLNNDFPVTMAFITDKLPPEVTFVSATAGGNYDSETHSVGWDIGTVPVGAAQQCVKVVAKVKANTPSGTKILNYATMSSNETPPETKKAQTTVRVALFKLGFPLSGYTPYTAPVVAVMDHGCFSSNPVKFYVRNGRVKALNGEVGKRIYGVLIKNGIWRGYRNEAGTSFLQTVLPNYTGGEYLFYDGHAGYDYEVPVGTPVKASGKGRLFIAQTDPVNGGGWSWYQTFYINHGNGYSSWYLYAGLDPALLAKVLADGFVQVQKGEVIGTTWNPWLHFDVRRGGNEPKNVRDPYKDELWEQPPG